MDRIKKVASVPIMERLAADNAPPPPDPSYEGDVLEGKKHGYGRKRFRDGSTYEGEWRNDMMHGKGRFEWREGDAYEGAFDEGMMTGQGVKIFHDNSRYEGGFKLGDFHGYGELIDLSGPETYQGQFNHGLRHGRGRMEFVEGHVYEGLWKDDKIDGTGIMHYANGNSYEGEWVNGKFHGTGAYVWASGSYYKGELVKGKRHGSGMFVFASGARYVGDFKVDKFHGKGIMEYATGDRYDGCWEDGMRHGFGRLDTTAGDVYEGQWSKNKRNGHGELTCANGTKYRGEWESDRKEGRGFMLFASGNRYEGPFVDNKFHGMGRFLWANGVSFEGEFRNGVIEGYGSKVYPDGQRAQGQWRNDQLVASADGVTATLDSFELDVRSGESARLPRPIQLQSDPLSHSSPTYREGKALGTAPNSASNSPTLAPKRGSLAPPLNLSRLQSAQSSTSLSRRALLRQADLASNGSEAEAPSSSPTSVRRSSGAGTLAHQQGSESMIEESEERVDSARLKFTSKEVGDGQQYEGQTLDGVPHGKGQLVYRGGDVYQGQFRSGKMHGHGTLMNGACDVYEGEWKDGVCMPGPGVLTLRGGDRFVGDFEVNATIPHLPSYAGRGTLTSTNGDVFVGRVIEGRPRSGTMYYHNGAKLEGQFSDDGCEGRMTYVGGAVYEGAWKHGRCHGKGVLFGSDGSVLRAQWKRDGPGELTDASRTVYRGTWRSGVLHGQVQLVMQNGGEREASYVNGHMHGRATYTDPEGQIFQEQWDDGLCVKQVLISTPAFQLRATAPTSPFSSDDESFPTPDNYRVSRPPSPTKVTRIQRKGTPPQVLTMPDVPQGDASAHLQFDKTLSEHLQERLTRVRSGSMTSRDGALVIYPSVAYAAPRMPEVVPRPVPIELQSEPIPVGRSMSSVLVQGRAALAKHASLPVISVPHAPVRALTKQRPKHIRTVAIKPMAEDVGAMVITNTKSKASLFERERPAMDAKPLEKLKSTPLLPLVGRHNLSPPLKQSKVLREEKAAAKERDREDKSAARTARPVEAIYGRRLSISISPPPAHRMPPSRSTDFTGRTTVRTTDRDLDISVPSVSVSMDLSPISGLSQEEIVVNPDEALSKAMARMNVLMVDSPDMGPIRKTLQDQEDDLYGRSSSEDDRASSPVRISITQASDESQRRRGLIHFPAPPATHRNFLQARPLKKQQSVPVIPKFDM